MGAMYFAMIFVGWNAHQTMEKYVLKKKKNPPLFLNP